MELFNLEIRKVGLVKNLYADVDRVLKNSDIPSGGVSAGVRINTIAHTIHKMLQPGATFYVCDINKCASVAGVHISIERMSIYSTIHCMKWSEMLPDFRQQVMAMILDDFRSVLNPIDVSTSS